MKHAKLSVGRENFIKWIEARNRIEPLSFRMNDNLYNVRSDYFPEQEHTNAQLCFIGIHEDKYNFEIDFCDELGEFNSPQFPEDENLGFLNIVNVDDNNIDLYYFFFNKDFEKEVDLLLSSTPKSWDLEMFTDHPARDEQKDARLSRKDQILDLWNKNFLVKEIRRELKKSNIDLSEKSINNILCDLRKKLGVDKVPLRRKKK